MDRFLPQQDKLGERINDAAHDLFKRLSLLNVDSLGLPAHCLDYYRASHSKRLFFSVETSAHLLYRAISLTNKSPDEIVLMDYGAGVGTLYLLASVAGCKRVIYNDHLSDWQLSAELIAKAVSVNIDNYIVGDIDNCLDTLDSIGARCDIITSRNVIEHIYRLDKFYSEMRRRQPGAILYSSTTANAANPAAAIKHALWHQKWEKVYRGKRRVVIGRRAPGLSEQKTDVLAKATRGLAVQDLELAIERYRQKGSIPDPRPHRTNTCDPSTGVWAEHLLTKSEYCRLINEQSYEIKFAPGFWDTHYQKRHMNMIGRLLNKIIAKGGATAMRVAPFIYVIARPK